MATVVTGAGGHVGSTLVRALLARGREVVCVDLADSPGLEGLDVRVHHGDIRDADFLRGVIGEGDTVFHLASVISTSGDKGGLVPSVNVDGARNVATVCREQGVARLIHTSSIHAYDIDTHGAPVTEETPLAIGRSTSAYNVSKARGQLAVLEQVAQGLDAVVVNPCGVIGPYDYKASRMGKFFRAMDKGTAGWVGPGGFNWVDVRDVVDGMLLAEEKGRAGEAYILAGHWNTNLTLARLAGELLDKPTPTRAIPMPVLDVLHALGRVLSAFGQRPPVTKEALDALKANPEMSHAKATAELGYRPRDVEETIRGIYDWIRDEDVHAKDAAAKAARKAAKSAA